MLDRPLHLTTLRDDNILHRLIIGTGPNLLNHSHDIHAVNHLAENNVLAVEMRCRRRCDEEL